MSRESQKNDHETIFVLINGEPREVAAGLNLSDLIRELALAPERIAIELNHKVVRRHEWPAKKIADGDQIEMVHFVGGGHKPRPKGGATKRAVIEEGWPVQRFYLSPLRCKVIVDSKKEV